MNPLYNYTIKLADDTLIFGQRLGELCGQGPYLEEDIALTNIALDYLGQSSNFFKYAAQVQGENRTEDDLAFLRLEKDYLNCQLSELPNGDYANTILKVYFFSLYQKLLYTELMKSPDAQLAAIAEKSLKEVKYHYTQSSTWVKMLWEIFGNIPRECLRKHWVKTSFLPTILFPTQKSCMKSGQQQLSQTLKTSEFSFLKALLCRKARAPDTIPSISGLSSANFSICSAPIRTVPGNSDL